MPLNNVYWSIDGENFPYENLGELMKANSTNLSPGDLIYSGEAEKLNPSDYFSTYHFLVDMEMAIRNDKPEAVEDETDQSTPETVSELRKYIKDWLNRNFKITWCSIINVKEITLTQEHFSETY